MKLKHWILDHNYFLRIQFLSRPWNTGPALILSRVLESLWQFVGLEKAFDCVTCGILWGCCGSMGYEMLC